MSGPLDLIHHAIKSFIPSEPPPEAFNPFSNKTDNSSEAKTPKDQVILPGHTGFLDEASKSRLNNRRDSLILKYHSTTSHEERLGQSFTIAFLSTVLGYAKDFSTWSETAITNAGQLPGGTELAVPTIKGDLAAVSGDYDVAAAQYNNALHSLKLLESEGIDVEEQRVELKNRKQQVYYAQAFKALSEMKGKGDVEKRFVAVVALNKLYKMVPTEVTLATILSAYTSSGWDLAELRRSVDATEAYIHNYEGWMAEQFLMTGDSRFLTPGEPVPILSPFRRRKAPETIEGFGEQVNQLVEAMHVSFLKSQNDIGREQLETILNGLERLVADVHKDDLQERYIQLAELYTHVGDSSAVHMNLAFAHQAFKKKLRGPSSELKNEDVIKDVTVLHRLASLSKIDVEGKLEYLKEATTGVRMLRMLDINEPAAYLELENAVIEAGITEQLAFLHFQTKKLTEEEFREEVKSGYEKVCDIGRKNVDSISRAKTKEHYVGLMFDGRISLLEHELTDAMVTRLKEDETAAYIISDSAQKAATADMSKYARYLKGDSRKEVEGRHQYVLAYYDFRSGHIAKAIQRLQYIQNNSVNCEANRAMFKKGEWPVEYGITNSDGTFEANLGKPSTVHGLKEMAGQLDEQQGRGLVACGVGAAAVAGLDLVIGEKITGAQILGACAVAYTIDRGAVISDNWNQISDAYDMGVSTVSTEEALVNAGTYLLDMGSVYLGGLSGRITQEALLKAGVAMKRRGINWLVKRGAMQAWTRPVVPGFLLREAAYFGNAYVFNKTTKGIQSAIHDDPPGKPQESNDLFASWLFVRFLPLFHAKKNIGGAIVKGQTTADAAARFGINTGAAATTMQGVLSLGAPSEGKFRDRVAHTFRDLALLHLGSKTFESVIAPKVLKRFGIELEKMRPEKTPKDLEYEALKAEEKPETGERWDWLIRRTTQEAVHAGDFIGSIGRFLGKIGNGIAEKVPGGWLARGLARDVIYRPTRWLVRTFVGKPIAIAGRLLGKVFKGSAKSVRDELTRLKETDWEARFPDRPDAGAQSEYVHAAKENTAPWQRRGRYSDKNMDGAAKRLQGEGADTTIFGEHGEAPTTPRTFRDGLSRYLAETDPAFKAENAEPLGRGKRFKRGVHALNYFLTYPFRFVGRQISNAAKEAAAENPRLTATRRVKLATKEAHREATKPFIEDSPPVLDVLWKAITGNGKPAENKPPSGVGRLWGKTKEVLGPFFGDVFMPTFELAHVASIYYAIGDITANTLDTDDDEGKEHQLFDVSLPGAIAFVAGSNYIVGKMLGITTLGGGLIAETFKTMTWGMLVSMEGSDPFKYFTKKPYDIAWLHMEYFAVLMAQVGLYSGMHAKSGNPIYNVLTNIPGLRNVPSLTRYYKYYAARSSFFKPDLVGAGRLFSLGYVAPFHMMLAEATKDKSILDSHGYLVWHRVLKTIHLGLWLKPLGAKLNQAGTLGQFVERSTGMIADWIDGLITPIKVGKGTYKGRLVDNIRGVGEEFGKLQGVAALNHKIFTKATQSLDVIGPLGNRVADKAGHPGKVWWRSGWRTEVEGVSKFVEIMENGIKHYPDAAVNDAMAMEYTLANPDALEIDFNDNSDAMSVVNRSMMYKMFAGRAETDATYRPYMDLVYGAADPRVREYWKKIPTVKSVGELNDTVARINDGKIKPVDFLKTLR